MARSSPCLCSLQLWPYQPQRGGAAEDSARWRPFCRSCPALPGALVDLSLAKWEDLRIMGLAGIDDSPSEPTVEWRRVFADSCLASA